MSENRTPHARFPQGPAGALRRHWPRAGAVTPMTRQLIDAKVHDNWMVALLDCSCDPDGDRRVGVFKRGTPPRHVNLAFNVNGDIYFAVVTIPRPPGRARRLYDLIDDDAEAMLATSLGFETLVA